jgi:hypothetical protein
MQDVAAAAAVSYADAALGCRQDIAGLLLLFAGRFLLIHKHQFWKHGYVQAVFLLALQPPASASTMKKSET